MSIIEKDTEELSEEQLRTLYDSEEIDRFLNLFSAYVSEVRLPDGPVGTEARATVEPTASSDGQETPLATYTFDGESHDSEEWTSIRLEIPANVPPLPRPPSEAAQDVSLSRQIALKYLIPYLPLETANRPTFTLGRLRLTTQRLYLAVAPPYERLLIRTWRLATWQKRETSLRYCVLFWVLWYQNLLLPAFFARILYALVRRKIFPYPSLSELRQRREEVGRANAFGREVGRCLAAPPTIVVNELWRFVKLASVARLTASARGTHSTDTVKDSQEIRVETQQATTVLEKDTEQEEVEDIKSTALFLMDQISDLHERIRNLFLWRQPQSCWLLILILVVLCLVTACVPAKYLAKVAYATGGTLFWHVIPILFALTDAERARLPPPLHTLPADADYAMDLISQRVARGLDVRPSSKRHGSSNSVSSPAGFGEQPGDVDNNAKWKKWSDRVAHGKAWIEGGRRLIKGQEWSRIGSWPPPAPLIPNLAFAHSAPDLHVETHTFPAQHAKAPGLITLTTTSFFFTPLISSTAKVVISLASIRAVKKVGPMKGLHIRGINGHSDTETEERFAWVGGRDELFARLVSWQGRRWIRI
ncbi:hypothetical protein NEOLEDRAFT_1053072 [Neolentinus lepideus HHB14362 ss-1]|uniref:Uncharacterized protein n=1 Tax=Neolentinus lepideus HHB14362 ss-1 TaxID=1314782 RepID=A0A165W2G4_9AGAM|nr:hypothetical protein NEOLEDRAFT_1053072 [Neolentinus lepideus HHB14362 ss-1]